MSRPIASTAITLAESAVGVQEEGENRGKWIEVYQSFTKPKLPPGSPYCMAAIVTWYRKAAHQNNLSIPADWCRTGYCPDHYRWAKKAGLWIPYVNASLDPTLIKRGDYGLFWFRSLNRHAHAFIVSEVHEWGVTTIEANTSPTVSSESDIDRDGDGVWSKNRIWSSLGLYGGFISMNL